MLWRLFLLILLQNSLFSAKILTVFNIINLLRLMVDKFLFSVVVCVVCSMFCSCGNGGNNKAQQQADSLLAVMRADRAELDKYQMITIRPETDVVKIHFKEGESPFFDVVMMTRKSNNVSIYFFNANDVTSDGKIKSGATPCRSFMMFLPEGETVDRFGYGGIDLIRSDYTVHHIDFELVDQPSL